MPNLVLSCFSGAGGMDLGLEAAGFDSVGCIELDSLASDTLTKNREGKWPVLEVNDVVKAGESLKPSDLDIEPRQLTLLTGGPPCQPFSMAAQWRQPKQGMEDDRGKTVLGMLNLAESMLPEAILIENVAGFLRGKNSAADAIEGKLKEINAQHKTSYRLHHWVLNAADYGVAQNRRRAIAVAFRDLPEDIELPLPPAPFADNPLTAWDALAKLKPAVVPEVDGGYAELLASIPEGSNYQYLTAKGGGPAVELFGYRTRYWSFLLKLRRDAPAWTLPASPGPSTGPFHWDNRPLAIAERLALQGFPSTWKLAGSARDGVRLVGNATPAPLAEAMGRYVTAVIGSGGEVPSADELTPTLAVKRQGTPPKPVAPAPLPQHWLAKVGSKVAHPGPGEGPAGHSKESDPGPA
ncbi:DNA cytosine methyltransferase [Nocardioides sp.]|uniref:DNA cytosine methyltransferase n=1 Tax=Nocardioides sp. TaxID=35761 RepID=UPI002D06EA8B|nr:DNA cytosine methyltransferase [Nocardioides sp.]HXH78427.1 DNA cytosine methyltransferase [Nocardioides sp.]